MEILIGADVDPILPARLDRSLEGDIWGPVDLIQGLENHLGQDLPPITWLIRVDDSVRFATGSYVSGYRSRSKTWERLVSRGHELGWHVHFISTRSGVGRFDPDPEWFHEAYRAAATCFPVSAARMGWDYGSNTVFTRLEEANIPLDFSALPGNIIWQRAGSDQVLVDWLGSPEHPYFPSRSDYRVAGENPRRVLEAPITQFDNDAVGVVKRIFRRTTKGRFTLQGLTKKTRLLTQPWRDLPSSRSANWAFFFHPEDLTAEGVRNFALNVKKLASIPGARFVTATQAARWAGEARYCGPEKDAKH